MADYLGRDFVNTTEIVDGNTYTQCSFTDCNIVYRGGEIPKIAGCRLERCRWMWEGSALRTIQFLKGIYSGMGPGGRAIVEDVLREIRAPFPKAPA